MTGVQTCALPISYEFGGADAEELAAGFPGARVELVDGRALTWYGPRIPAALGAYRELLEAAASGSTS